MIGGRHFVPTVERFIKNSRISDTGFYCTVVYVQCSAVQDCAVLYVLSYTACLSYYYVLPMRIAILHFRRRLRPPPPAEHPSQKQCSRTP